MFRSIVISRLDSLRRPVGTAKGANGSRCLEFIQFFYNRADQLRRIIAVQQIQIEQVVLNLARNAIEAMILPLLDVVDTDLVRLEADLAEDGAPWTPGRGLP